MSGGVDSSVTAALLKKKGYDVIGIMLDLWSDTQSSQNACCTQQSHIDARKIAEQINIPFYLIECKELFKAVVIKDFIDTYSKFMTPNPCIICNQIIKFGKLLDEAKIKGADYLATGHYVNLLKENSIFHILKGIDPLKDQSYFLYRLNQNQLSKLMFPLGRHKKSEIREIASQLNIHVANKPESQDICFIGNNGYREFLNATSTRQNVAGPIMTSDGKILGEHRGLRNYTVGQRRGLAVSYQEPLYVLALDPERTALIVGTNKEREKRSLMASLLNFTNGLFPDSPFKTEVKVRYSAKATPAKAYPIDEDKVRLEFDYPILDITPGQSAVFYQENRLIGGGIILFS